MEKNKRIHTRAYGFFPVVYCIFMIAAALLGGTSYGQDLRNQAAEPSLCTSHESEPEMQRLSEQGETVWRKDVNSGCSYSDHHITINIPVEPDEISDTKITMTNQDVDYNDPQGCDGGPEVDYLYINGNFIGQLQGANNSWSTNVFEFPSSYLKKGDNLIFVDTDATNTDCWCVGVGYVEISGKVGFRIISHTPEKDQENVLWNAPGITVTFSNEVKKESVEGKDNIILEYRNQQGTWTKVNAQIKMVSATKAQVTPSGNLMDGVRYRVRVLDGPQGVLAKGDGQLEEGAEWHFWTMVNLEGQTADVFKPNTTKDKLQITWFNVLRNEDLVPYRWVANRIYCLWEPKAGVFDDDEVREIKAKVTFTVSGETPQKRDVVIKRPDLYTENEKKFAANTINFRHIGDTAAQEVYSVKVEPVPQSGTPKVFEKTATANRRAGSTILNFDYWACSMGSWYAGPVAGELAAAKSELSAGRTYTRTVFPVTSVLTTDKGTIARGNGGFNMEYTQTKASATWQQVMGNNAPPLRFVKDLTTNVEIEEYQQVMRHLANLRPANSRFIVGLIPENGIPGANGLSSSALHVILLANKQFNASTVAHEIGHEYGIAAVIGPGGQNNCRKHNNDGRVIEGFNPYGMDNKSYEEGNSEYDKVAHKLCNNVSYNTPVAPLMNKWGLPTAFRWIRPDNYRHLMNQVGAAAAVAQGLTGDFMIINGLLDDTGGIRAVDPLYRTKQRIVAAPSGTGYTAQLFSGPNGTGTSLGVFNFGPHTLSVDRSDGGVLDFPASFFAFSIPFDDAAQSLVVRKTGGGSVTINKADRGVGFPTAAFTNPANGANISGIVNLTWTGSDDGGTVYYRLEFSEDGTNWTPISGQMTNLNSFSFNTTVYRNGTGQKLALIAYDGFNTTRVEINVNINNNVTVSSTEPPAGATGVSLDQVVSASFVGPMNATTFKGNTFILLKSGASVAARVSYDPSARTAFLEPLSSLEPNTLYTARLVGGGSGIKDSNGKTLPANFEWSFTTKVPALNPQVVLVSPPHGATNVPVSTLVSATFANALDASRVNGTTFTLATQGGQVVAGTVSYDAANKTALLRPNTDLAANTTYVATLTKGIQNPQGLGLENAYTWRFTTGSGVVPWVRIVRILSDQGKDNNGDGLYDELVVRFLVEVKESGNYNLNCQLKDKTGDDIEWRSVNGSFSQAGVYVMEVLFDGNKIAGRGVDGPYQVTNIYIYDQWNSGRYYSYPGSYWTYAYKANEFFSVLRLSQLPDVVVAVNSNNPSIINLDNYATHSKYSVNTLTWKILINTSPNAGVSISNARTINIAPSQGFNGYTDVTIEAKDQDGIRMLDTFRVLVIENYRFASAGWYLISLPVEPSNRAITSVLAGVAGKYGSVWTYSGGAWKLYDPTNPAFSDLTTMEAGKAYWIKMNQAGNLFVLGTGVEKTPVNLLTGWNFAGYNSTVASLPQEAFSSIAGRYLSVWAYKGGAWKLYDPANIGLSNLTVVEPGYGLWINSIMASEWLLP